MLRSIQLCLIGVGLSFFACKEEKKKPNVPLKVEVNKQAKMPDEPLPDLYDSNEVRTALTALPKPVIDTAFHKRAPQHFSFWYKYLLANFDTVSAKQTVRMRGNHICEFDQEFETGILYYQDFCHSGHSRTQVFFPATSPDDVIDLFGQMHALAGDTAWTPDFEWQADSAYFLARTDSSFETITEVKVKPEASGCELNIFGSD